MEIIRKLNEDDEKSTYSIELEACTANLCPLAPHPQISMLIWSFGSHGLGAISRKLFRKLTDKERSNIEIRGAGGENIWELCVAFACCALALDMHQRRQCRSFVAR